MQETQYDPAGLELAGLTAPSPGIRGLNNYRFNGRELQADLGLNWNHQDWRFFDPQLLRWHSVDPEVENGQESWTPYSFGYDNAVRYADANGRCPCEGDTPPQAPNLAASFVHNLVTGTAVSLINAAIITQPVLGLVLGGGKGDMRASASTTSFFDIDYAVRPAATTLRGALADGGSDALDMLNAGATVATAGAGGAGARGLAMGAGLLLEQGTGRVVVNEAAQMGKKALAEAGKLSSKNNANLVRLNKQLASEAQLAEKGQVIAGGSHKVGLRKAAGLAKEHGGKAENYVKMRSSSYTPTSPTGEPITPIESHWEQNTVTGQRFNQKTIVNPGQQ